MLNPNLIPVENNDFETEWHCNICGEIFPTDPADNRAIIEGFQHLDQHENAGTIIEGLNPREQYFENLFFGNQALPFGCPA